MNYELRHFNTPLVRFSATEDSNTPEINILWYDEEKKHLLPMWQHYFHVFMMILKEKLLQNTIARVF